MEGFRLTRLVQGPLSPAPRQGGAALALVPRSQLHGGFESPLPPGEERGAGAPRLTDPRVETGFEHPVLPGAGRGEGLPRVIPPTLERPDREGTIRGLQQAPLLPEPTPTRASATHLVPARSKRGSAATLAQLLVPSAWRTPSPHHGTGRAQILSPSLQGSSLPGTVVGERSRPGLFLPRAVSTGRERAARRGPGGGHEPRPPARSGEDRGLATRASPVMSALGGAIVSASSPGSLRRGVGAGTSAREPEQSPAPPLFRRARELTTQIFAGAGDGGSAASPVLSRQGQGRGAEAGTAADGVSEAPVQTPALGMREGGAEAGGAARGLAQALAPALSRGDGALAAQAHPVVKGMGGTLTPAPFQRERGARVEADTGTRDSGQPLTPVLLQEERGLATEVHTRGRDLGGRLSPELSALTPRERPPARRFSLTIGRLEIRTRPPSPSRTPSPPPIRSHQIDPGLGPGLLHLGSKPW